ncbi:hypothetical protein RU99_GL002298 [Enterococcus casseliflavus]|nr:hypothetical protein RU99_GL002298 [Enterococcus casseliflavus]
MRRFFVRSWLGREPIIFNNQSDQLLSKRFDVCYFYNISFLLL